MRFHLSSSSRVSVHHSKLDRRKEIADQAERELSSPSAWLRDLEDKLAREPQFCSSSPEIDTDLVQQETSQTQFDVLDYLRQLAQAELAPATVKQYRQEWRHRQGDLQDQLQQDLRVFLQEHLMLRHQSNVWPIEPGKLLADWLESGHKAVTKAQVLRDQANTKQLWQTRHLKLIRYQRETAQIEKLQQRIATFIARDEFVTVPAGEVLGPSLADDMTALGLNFPDSWSTTELHPGRLTELGLHPTDQIEISPKFTLLMPANGFVHPGNLVYQVVRWSDATGAKLHLGLGPLL